VTDNGIPPENDFEDITITVQNVNRPPVLTSIGVKGGKVGELLQFVITATDLDGGDTLTYSASNLPSGATFDAGTRTFSWTPGDGQAGVYENVHFTVTDNGTPQESDFEEITIIIDEKSTLIELSSFTAYPSDGLVVIEWVTESEIENVGFNLYRSSTRDGEYIQINDSMVLAEGSSLEGAAYQFFDEDVQNRKTYYYKLEDIDIYGVSTFHGSVSATPRSIYRR
jgi:hypothetical protein